MVLLALVAGCRSNHSRAMPDLAESVDLERFMGTWYVHGYSPTFLDRNAHDATEHYELRADGKIATTYRFRAGPEGAWKEYHPVGRVVEGTNNAEWRMRFFAIISQPYLVLHVDAAHTETIIGHPNRKLMWIMTRSPTVAEADYDRLVGILRRNDFEVDRLERVGHSAAAAR
jgi:apolipoprotein D and lipocalin family protein